MNVSLIKPLSTRIEGRTFRRLGHIPALIKAGLNADLSCGSSLHSPITRKADGQPAFPGIVFDSGVH